MATIFYDRKILKNGDGPPTIPPSPSHDLGDWIATDIYENEVYMDNLTRNVYTRFGDSIVLIGYGGKTATAINFADCTVTNPPTENDGDVYVLVDGTGSPMDVDTIEYQGGSLHTVRYNFIDFLMMGLGVGVAVGDYFHVKDALNSKHNGTFLITDFDDVAGWIEVYNALVSDAGDDEASDSPATAYFTKAAWDGGKPNDIAKFESSTGLWYIVTPEDGDTIVLTSDDYEYTFNGTYWESKLKNHIAQTGNVHDVQGSQITFSDTTITDPLIATNIDAALKELSARGSLYQKLSEKNNANGYAGLDASTKIPISLLPDSIVGALKFKGTWNSDTDIISSSDLSIDGDPLAGIPASSANEGWYFIVNTNGTTSIDGIAEWKIGDWVLSIGVLWRKIDNTDAVITVNGQIGNVVLDTDDISEGATNKYLTNGNFGALVTAASAAVPNDSDLVATVESSVLKKITWTNVKAFFKTYFDTLYTLRANNLSDVANAATAFGNIKQNASTSATGVVELAENGEDSASVVVQGNDTRIGLTFNGRIDVAVASNNITVSILTLAGATPSATDPVFIRLANGLRKITGALTLTMNAGTNWFNSGSAELATLEVDYFVYLGWNAANSTVVLATSRKVGFKRGDFSTTSTDENFLSESYTTGAADSDPYLLIGRHAATLSAGASYNWSVPTFDSSNLLQHPMFESRWLEWNPVYTGYSVDPSTVVSRYKTMYQRCQLRHNEGANGTSSAGTTTFTVPFTHVTLAGGSSSVGTCVVVNNGSTPTTPGTVSVTSATNVCNCFRDFASTAFTASGGKRVTGINGFYQIS